MSKNTIEYLQGAVAQIKQFITNDLGFDRHITVSFNIHSSSYQFYMAADDEFQKNIDYSKRVATLYRDLYDNDPENLLQQVWDKLNSHMRRDERELRFGLLMLGEALEGDGFNTEVGKMLAARMRKVRDEVSAKYLPKYEKEK